MDLTMIFKIICGKQPRFDPYGFCGGRCEDWWGLGGGHIIWALLGLIFLSLL